MKRSEMLELIRKDIFFCKCAEEDIDPERILLTIEKAGMLPPKYTALRRDGTKFIKGENEGDVIQRIAWEPEEGELE